MGREARRTIVEERPRRERRDDVVDVVEEEPLLGVEVAVVDGRGGQRLARVDAPRDLAPSLVELPLPVLARACEICELIGLHIRLRQAVL